MRRKLSGLVALSAVCVAVVGCGSHLKRRELERVAKDWALTIRASQVIPVYPLTEDLQPGDVFLVSKPIQRQHQEYQERGFLPLDQHLTRLRGLDFVGTYDQSFGVGKSTNTPHHWQFPPDGLTYPPPKQPEPKEPPPPPNPGGAGEGNKLHQSETLWRLSPRAGFPTYTFKVQSGAGAAVALPVQGVPVALSLIQADAATGSVTIADAYTYSVPYDKIIAPLKTWAGDPLNKHLLTLVHRDVVDADTWWDRFCRFFTGDSPPGVYLRVVNRVYLAGRVLVELTNDESVRGMGSGGAKKDVELPQLKSKEVAVNYADALSALATKVNNDLPGGTIKFAWATSRSVAMSETFDRPLVIGFLGFDFPVLDDGSLGAPVATFDQLEHKRLEPSSGKPLETSVERANLVLVRRQLESMVETEPRARALAARLDKLGALLPSNLPVTFYLEGPAVQTPEGTAPNLTPVEEKGAAITERNFQRLVSYWGQLEQSLKVIKDARALGGVHIGGKNDDPRINELPLTQRDTEREIERLRKEVGDNPVLHEALEYCVQSLKGEG